MSVQMRNFPVCRIWQLVAADVDASVTDHFKDKWQSAVFSVICVECLTPNYDAVFLQTVAGRALDAALPVTAGD